MQSTRQHFAWQSDSMPPFRRFYSVLKSVIPILEWVCSFPSGAASGKDLHLTCSFFAKRPVILCSSPAYLQRTAQPSTSVYLFRHRCTLVFPRRQALLSSPRIAERGAETEGFEPSERLFTVLLLSKQAHLTDYATSPKLRHILKGASYFCIARPLHFQISHSTGFLGTNRRGIRFWSPAAAFRYQNARIV